MLADKRAAFFAAAVFAALAPTLHLGSYATYDAPALLLLAAATWCAAGVRSRQRIVAAGILLALANATKYATALYDPTVLCVAFLGQWPETGRQIALRRTALLAGTAAAVLAVLLALGGTGYLTGIRVTTTGRVDGTDTASLVFADAWSWTAVVMIPAVIAVVVCAVRRQWSRALLLAVLAFSALLAPADQARIQTTTSLNKHVDFGAWFAALAAGYLLSSLSRRRAVLAVSLAALIPVTWVGTAQARDMIDWPNVTGLVKVVRPLTAHGGHFLVETTDVLQYYLPNTSWRQWSDTQNSNPMYYQRAIARHVSRNKNLLAELAHSGALRQEPPAEKPGDDHPVYWFWHGHISALIASSRPDADAGTVAHVLLGSLHSEPVLAQLTAEGPDRVAAALRSLASAFLHA